MPITTKDLQGDVKNGWTFVHRFVWPALVGGFIIGQAVALIFGI